MHRRSHPTFTIGTVVAAISAMVVCVSIAGVEGACGGGCSQAPPGVHVAFTPPLTTSDVASFTVTGACGPVPSPLCDPKAPGCNGPHGWDVYVPADAAGTCAVHVVLTDGETFDDTVSLSYSSGCGVGGYYGDRPVFISSKVPDAGAE